MNILSLFDGIGGAYQALKDLNTPVDNYFSSEIDKYAIQICKKNHPDIIELGDVKKIDTSKLPKIDLLVAGFPCQSFSIAGSQKGFDDERGNLFFDLMRIFKEVKPKYFLFENVASMKKEFRNKLDELVGVKSIMIDSALLTAQQRKRIYWTNIQGTRQTDLFGNREIEQPEDKEIYLKDIIEEGIVDRDKSYCIDANYYKGGNLKSYFEKGRRQLVFDKPVRVGHFNSGGQADRVYSINGKSVCLSALGGGGGAKTGLYAIAQRGRNIIDGKRKDIKGSKTKQRFETSYSEKSNCLTSVQKDSLLLDNSMIRKLTPIECERLQGYKDGYTEGISNTQRYKALGNSFTVPVIAHILKSLVKH